MSMSDQTCARLGQVNDGDLHVDGSTDIGEGGQKGWSGWGPYAVMYGKTPEQAGLVTLQATGPAPCAVSRDNIAHYPHEIANLRHQYLVHGCCCTDGLRVRGRRRAGLQDVVPPRPAIARSLAAAHARWSSSRARSAAVGLLSLHW